jgi:hypothetical protein
MVNSQQILERVGVEARGDDVVIHVGDEWASMTPMEAQRFAFHLARAYMSAGELARSRAGQIVLQLAEPGGHRNR